MKQLLAGLDNVMFEDQHPSQGDIRLEILQGLQQSQKTINPKFFYDARGSALFDQITRLPEYYPTRTETGILRGYREEIAACCGRSCIFIEPGSGNSEKVRILLDTPDAGASARGRAQPCDRGVVQRAFVAAESSCAEGSPRLGRDGRPTSSSC